MSANNVERQPETKDRAQAKQMIKTILKGWDHLTWDELLADDIILIQVGEGRHQPACRASWLQWCFSGNRAKGR